MNTNELKVVYLHCKSYKIFVSQNKEMTKMNGWSITSFFFFFEEKKNINRTCLLVHVSLSWKISM